MAYTFEEVQEKLNAEIVAGNLICGVLDKRVFVGKTNEDGMFEITPEGKEMLDAQDLLTLCVNGQVQVVATAL